MAMAEVLINMEKQAKASNLFFLLPRCSVTQVPSTARDTALYFFSFTAGDETISVILFSPVTLINVVLGSFVIFLRNLSLEIQIMPNDLKLITPSLHFENNILFIKLIY